MVHRGARVRAGAFALVAATCLAGCGDEEASSAATEPVEGIGTSLSGTELSIRTPGGEVVATVGEPVDVVDASEAADGEEHEPGPGQVFVPVVVTQEPVDDVPDLLAIEQRRSEVQPRISLRAGGESVALGSGSSAVEAGSALSARQYVAVPEEAADEPVLEVEFDGVTQTVSADGTVEAGVAAPLYEPWRTVDKAPCTAGWDVVGTGAEPRIAACWFDAVETPYAPGVGWAEDGASWTLIQVAPTVEGLTVRNGGDRESCVAQTASTSLTGEATTVSELDEAAPGGRLASETAVVASTPGQWPEVDAVVEGTCRATYDTVELTLERNLLPLG